MGQQAPGHLLEQFIAHFMALAVVEGLEVIQIQKQQCTDLPRALGLHDGPAQAVEQQAAVGQAGEGIVEGQVLYLLLGAAQVGHVVVGDHQTTVGGVPLLQLDAAPIGQQLLRRAHAFTLLRLPFLNPLFAFGLRGGRQQISGRLLQQDAKRQLRGDIGGQPGVYDHEPPVPVHHAPLAVKQNKPAHHGLQRLVQHGLGCGRVLPRSAQLPEHPPRHHSRQQQDRGKQRHRQQHGIALGLPACQGQRHGQTDRKAQLRVQQRTPQHQRRRAADACRDIPGTLRQWGMRHQVLTCRYRQVRYGEETLPIGFLQQHFKTRPFTTLRHLGELGERHLGHRPIRHAVQTQAPGKKEHLLGGGKTLHRSTDVHARRLGLRDLGPKRRGE